MIFSVCQIFSLKTAWILWKIECEWKRFRKCCVCIASSSRSEYFRFLKNKNKNKFHKCFVFYTDFEDLFCLLLLLLLLFWLLLSSLSSFIDSLINFERNRFCRCPRANERNNSATLSSSSNAEQDKLIIGCCGKRNAFSKNWNLN